MQGEKLPFGNTVAERLRLAAVGTGKTDRELAIGCGLTPASLSRYLSGDREPNADALLKLSRLLGVSPFWILYGEPDKATMDRSAWQARAEAAERKVTRLKKMLQEALAEL